MGKRSRRREAERTVETVDYTDAEGNVLTLRQSLTPGTVAKIGEPPSSAAASQDDAWRRRGEMLFERLTVRWEIAGLPLEGQRELLGRYRMADPDLRRWVLRTVTDHARRKLPELGL